MNQNIKNIRKALQLTQAEFSKSLGIEQGSYSDLERGRSKTLSKSIQLILQEKYNVNIDYLFNGIGEMFETKSSSQNLQEPKLEYAPKYKAIPANPEDSDAIPLLDIAIEAGALKGFAEAQRKVELPHYKVPGFKGADFLVTVSGESMIDRYWPGDIIGCKIINHKSFLQWGKVHVLDTTQGGLLKKIMPSEKEEHIKAVSFNSDNYPAFNIPECEILRMAIVIGVVRLV